MPQRAVGLVQRLGEDVIRVELEGPPAMDLGQHAGYFPPRPEGVQEFELEEDGVVA
jgi:hypothetical protein